MKLEKKIISGVGWSSLATFASQGLRLLFKLILAKVLLPEHYGIIGMASVVISFVEVVSELGLNSALIQRKKETLSPVYYDTAFWANLGISAIGFLLIWIGIAPLAAWFYQEPVLEQLIPVLSFSILINSFYIIPKTRLSRDMDFKPQAFIEIGATALAGVLAITLAFMGMGVWALAFNTLTYALALSVFYGLHTRWLPRFRFSYPAFKDLFGFGSKVLAESIFSFFTLNIDYILIGKLIGGAALGAYTLAFMLTSTLMKQVTKILNKVLYPAYAAIKDDLPQVGVYYLQLAKINNLIIAPVMTFIIVMADSIILVGFGSEWRETVVPLQILATAVIISSLGGSASIVMRSQGRPDLSMKVNMLCTTFSTVPLVIAGAVTYGIQGAAGGILLDRVIRLISYQTHMKRLIGVSLWQLFSQVMGTMGVCLLIGSSIYLLDQLMHISHWVELIFAACWAGVLYLVYLIFAEHELIDKFLQVTRLKHRIPLSLLTILKMV